jgi:hypothetical protein
LKAPFTRFAAAVGCLLLGAGFANTRNYSFDVERFFAQAAPRTPQATNHRCRDLVVPDSVSLLFGDLHQQTWYIF